jgi:iron complex transport system ATP-binding protein
MKSLEVKNASVERGGRLILRDASIAVSPGELVVLVGPNGSGKSTMLRVLAGLWTVKSGSVELDGTPMQSIARNEAARRIAFVPQDTQIEFAFTVAEILAMGRYPHRGRFAPETKADRIAIDEAAVLCDVSHLFERTIDTLSGGERQRVLIARSLAIEPEIILLDEPTANLDIEHAIEILELCRSLAERGKAVVLASHDLNSVAQQATRVALLRAGSIVAVGPREEVLTAEALAQTFRVDARRVAAPDGKALYIFSRLRERSGARDVATE